MVSVEGLFEGISRLVDRARNIFKDGEYDGYEWNDYLFGMPVKVEAEREEIGLVRVVVRERPTGAPFLSLTFDPQMGNITEVEAHF